jgi:hypothetical protein
VASGPIGFDEAMQMIQKIKGGKVLRGLREKRLLTSNTDGASGEAFATSGRLPDDPEIDINPVMVFQSAGGAQALMLGSLSGTSLNPE